MDRSKYFVTALHANRDYMSIPHLFYQRWMHGRQTNNVTMEDSVGNTFACYVEVVDGQPFLVIEANHIRSIYLIPNGALMEMRYIRRSRFKFKIPMSGETLVEDDVAYAGSVVTEEHEDAVSYVDEEFEYAVSDDDDDDDDDDDGDAIDSGLGGN